MNKRTNASGKEREETRGEGKENKRQKDIHSDVPKKMAAKSIHPQSAKAIFDP